MSGGMNGRRGRAKVLARIRREREAEARATGVDTTDRVAFRAWEKQRDDFFYSRLLAELSARRLAASQEKEATR